MTASVADALRWVARDRWVALALALFAWATRAPFVYRGGMGDGDSMVIAAGIARGLSPDVPLADAIPYGRQISPGIALIMRAVGPWLLRCPDQTLPFLNGLAVAVAGLLALPLYALYRRWMPASTSAVCTGLVLTAPLVWEAGTYFHPIMPAVLLLCTALLTGRRIGRSTIGVGYALSTFALASAALLMRAEVALIAPALAVWAMASPRPRRNLGLLLGIGLVASLLFLAVSQMLTAGARTAPTGLRQYIHEFAVSYFRPRALLRNGVWAPMAVGWGTLGLVALGLWTRGRRARARNAPTGAIAPLRAVTRGDALGSLLWVAIPALFWLPNPVPLMRHFLLLVPALGAWAGWLWLRPRSVRATVAWGVLAAVLNVASPEAVYALASRARPAASHAPHGTFFAHHRESLARSRTLRRRVDDVARLTATFAAADLPAPAPGEPLSAWGEAPLVLVEVDWDTFGHVLYWLATASPAWEPCPATPAGAQRFRRGSVTLELLLGAYDLDLPSLRAAVQRVRDGGGHVRLTPRAAAALGPDALDARVRAFD